ncbi:MAG: VOC family protein [Gemmatimonadaceae bacterium]|nr:VOC family protein [Gemmatimonadaceae bacterium]MCW5827076.1 VOC family protein [Gemmatimonadaceae bacterium]
MADIKLGKIQQIALVQHDVERAVPFYRDGLGLPLLFETAGMAFFDAGGVRLMLSKPSRAEVDHKNSIMYFEVADCAAAYEALAARGVPFDEAPHVVGRTATHEIWVAFCRDPEDNILAISEARAL